MRPSMRVLAILSMVGCLHPAQSIAQQAGGSTAPHTPAVGADSLQVARLSPALDELIAPGAGPEAVHGGYVLTEGPMWRGGRLWFSDEQKVLGRTLPPEVAANLVWGGKDGATPYITAHTHAYRLRTQVKGYLPAIRR